jgi:hypothetical protein
MRQGIAPWRGRGDGLTLDCFFLMRGAAIRSSHYRSEGSRQLSLEAQASDSYSNGEAVSTVILLFFEQAVKCGASIVSIARCGTRVRDDRSLGRRSHSDPVSCDSNPRSKELAVVRLILYRDSHRDGFQTLEAGGRIEVYTLLAAMKRHAALGTYAVVVKVRRQHDRAAIAPGRGNILNEAGKPRPCDIKGKFRAALPATIVFR